MGTSKTQKKLKKLSKMDGFIVVMSG